MIEINLHRVKIDGKAVRGTLNLTLPFDGKEYRLKTLENAEFLIPTGTYELERTWSPKFRKFLPEILNVPERSGIRIHRGTIPEHSTGCVLTDMYGMAILETLFTQLNFIKSDNENENIFITISSEQTKC